MKIKKKHWKMLALVLALGLIGYLAILANSLVGNPISEKLAQRGAEKYLQEQFPGTDYYVEKVGYNFKFTNYYAHIRSEKSIDTQFTLHIDFIGRVEWDTYDDVTRGFVTERRLNEAYRALTDGIFDDPDFPYGENIGFGELIIYSQEVFDNPDVTDVPDYAMHLEELVIDGEYDVRELGARCGHLVVYVESEDLTYETAAEIMLNIRAMFDAEGIPFRALDFVLQLPKPEEGPWPEEDIRVDHFPYEEIVAEGLEARLEKAHEELMAYYEYLDSQKIK